MVYHNCKMYIAYIYTYVKYCVIIGNIQNIDFILNLKKKKNKLVCDGDVVITWFLNLDVIFNNLIIFIRILFKSVYNYSQIIYLMSSILQHTGNLTYS